MTLTLNFQGQIWNLLYLSQICFDYQEIKSTHIEWTEGLNDHQVWPWLWTWKVKCKDLPDSDRGDFRCRRAVDSSSLTVGAVTEPTASHIIFNRTLWHQFCGWWLTMYLFNLLLCGIPVIRHSQNATHSASRPREYIEFVT